MAKQRISYNSLELAENFRRKVLHPRTNRKFDRPASQPASQPADWLWGRSLARTLKYRGFLFFSCYTYRLAAPTYFAPACSTERCTPHHCGNSSRDVSRALLTSHFYSSSSVFSFFFTFFLFTFPSLSVFTSRFSRPDILLLRPSHSTELALSLAFHRRTRRWLFLSFPALRSKPHHGAAIYANILDNKSRRVIYEVSPFNHPVSEHPRCRLPGVTPVQFEN